MTIKRQAGELENDGIAPDIIKRIKTALQSSLSDFNMALTELPNDKTAWTIRSKATVVNNRLINRWYRNWKTASKVNTPANN